MARGRLTKNEKYLIEGMHKDNISVSDIADELGRTQRTVQKYIEGMKSNQIAKPKKKKKKTSTPKPIIAKDLIINETVAKRQKGVSIMTEAASSRADESRDTGTYSRFFNGAIQQINPDE